jgi:hypothetical protein
MEGSILDESMMAEMRNKRERACKPTTFPNESENDEDVPEDYVAIPVDRMFQFLSTKPQVEIQLQEDYIIEDKFLQRKDKIGSHCMIRCILGYLTNTPKKNRVAFEIIVQFDDQGACPLGVQPANPVFAHKKQTYCFYAAVTNDPIADITSEYIVELIDIDLDRDINSSVRLNNFRVHNTHHKTTAAAEEAMFKKHLVVDGDDGPYIPEVPPPDSPQAPKPKKRFKNVPQKESVVPSKPGFAKPPPLPWPVRSPLQSLAPRKSQAVKFAHIAQMIPPPPLSPPVVPAPAEELTLRQQAKLLLILRDPEIKAEVKAGLERQRILSDKTKEKLQVLEQLTVDAILNDPQYIEHKKAAEEVAVRRLMDDEEIKQRATREHALENYEFTDEAKELFRDLML